LKGCGVFDMGLKGLSENRLLAVDAVLTPTGPSDPVFAYRFACIKASVKVM